MAKIAKMVEMVEMAKMAKMPKMLEIKGGSFQMSGNKYSVTLQDFHIGEYPVKVKEFAAFIKATNYLTDADRDKGSYIWNGSVWEITKGVNWKCDVAGNLRLAKDYTHPVIHVSWNDAVAYCAWLSKITGENYRLPSEAEWEYAASGGNQSKGYEYAGSNNLDEVGWFKENSDYKTHPVGRKKPNELGIYDMSGNVWEWCQDVWHDNYNGEPNNGSAWTEGEDNRCRVLRGGSWDDDDDYSRVQYRFRLVATIRINLNGFRLARD